MTTPPRLPKLPPNDMAWARWVTDNVRDHGSSIDKLHTRTKAASQQRAATSQTAAGASGTISDLTPVLPTVPDALPLQPTTPTASTDHGTVTIQWDGRFYAATADASGSRAIVPPPTGYWHVNVDRLAPGAGQQWTHVSEVLINHASTVVDVNVVVGSTYQYRLVTVDNLGRHSAPSATVSVTVKGVDLGSLDSELQSLITDLKTGTTTGGLVYYGSTPPTDATYHNSSALWFDTSSPTGAVPNRWDAASEKWVPIPWGTGALGDGSIVASKIVAGAIDTAAIAAGAIKAQQLAAGSVIAGKIGTDAVTANTITAGAIDANKLAVGAVQTKHIQLDAAVPSGNSNNRVPRPLYDSVYWSQVIDGTVPLGNAPVFNVNATANGLIFTPSATQIATVPVTTFIPVPTSRAITVHLTPDNDFIQIVVGMRTATGGYTEATVAADDIFTLDDTAQSYRVMLQELTGLSSVIVADAAVFEIIGVTGTGQSARLSPAGLQLFNDSGNLSVDLTTSSSNFISIYNDGDALATVDENGDATFQTLQVNNDILLDGNPLDGGFSDYARSDGIQTGRPLLYRLPLGIFYMASWASMDNYVVNTQYQRIASGSFKLPPGRQYLFNTDLGGLQAVNNSGVNAYVELQLSTAPVTNVTDGTIVQRAVVYNGDSGTWAMPPIVLKATKDAALSPGSNTIPGDVDLYWQINTNLSATPTTPYTMHQYSASAGLTVIDIGANMIPLTATDRTTGGATATGSAGSGSPGTSTSTTTTKTWTADWSASWRESGATKVIGTGTYTDADRLYQGLGVTPMGAKFGFSVTSDLTGKTISKVEVFLQNRWTWATGGGTAYLAGHANASEPATYGSNVSGTNFSSFFARGQGKWITIPDSAIPFASWKSGAVRGISLTVRSGDQDYQYYDGVGKSSPPKLRITYS